MRLLSAIFMFSLLVLVKVQAAPVITNLWPDGEMPGAMPIDFDESVDPKGCIRGISVPELYFCPADKQTSDATVLICPGGGYSCLSFEKEGLDIAQWFNARGMSVFIVKNRVKEYGQPWPLADVQRALRMIRKNSRQYNINPEKVGIMGFSAGGHLAATASTLYDEKVYEMADDTGISARPDYSMLIYPVISMGAVTHQGSKENLLGKNPSQELVDKYSCEKQIDSNTPPAILIHSGDDRTVPVANSIMYYQGLLAGKVDAEMHLFNVGGHGYGMKSKSGTAQHWPEILEHWLREKKYLAE